MIEFWCYLDFVFADWCLIAQSLTLNFSFRYELRFLMFLPFGMVIFALGLLCVMGLGLLCVTGLWLLFLFVADSIDLRLSRIRFAIVLC